MDQAGRAALAGATPIEASRGKNIRRRLNPYEDRALNRALHHIALTLERCDPKTCDYLARRTIEAKTRREAIRYLARKIYRSDPLPRSQDLPRPRTPATHHRQRLTNIEASYDGRRQFTTPRL
jgi:hypothetical protein